MRRYPNLFQGQSLVEFALIAPLLFALLFAVIELGIVMSVYIGLANGANEAARAGWAFRYQAPIGATGTPTVAAVDAQRAEAMNQALMATRHPLIQVAAAAGFNPVYSYQPPSPSSNNYRAGDKLLVEVSYNRPLFFGLIGTQITLRARSETWLEPGVGP